MVPKFIELVNETVYNTFKIHNNPVNIIIQRNSLLHKNTVVDSRNIQNFKIQTIFQKRKSILQRVVSRESGVMFWARGGMLGERSRAFTAVADSPRSPAFLASCLRFQISTGHSRSPSQLLLNSAWTQLVQFPESVLPGLAKQQSS